MPASSAYESAENSAVIPASTKETTTAGPASGTASPSTTKIPVPRVAPTLSSVSWLSPMVRRSGPPLASATSPATLRRLVSLFSPCTVPLLPLPHGP